MTACLQPQSAADLKCIERRVDRALYEAVRLRRVRRQDVENVAQELWGAIWERLPRFDSLRSSLESFVDVVIAHALVDRNRREQARKRSPAPGRVLRFSADMVGEIEIDLRRPASPIRGVDQATLAIDVATVLTRLPSFQADIVRRLESESLASVARSLGVSRSCVKRARAAARRVAHRMGLGHESIKK